MDTKAETLDLETHRRLGVDLFNKTWTLMEKEDARVTTTTRCSIARTRRRITGCRSGRRRIVRAASGSARACTPCSAAPEPALHHAQRCLEICESEPGRSRTGICRSRTRRSRARTRSPATPASCRRCLEQARSLGAAIADDDDRALLEADLATIRT